ncbi:MAG: hypothetical protein KGH49_01880 [Candidatus Micrarchaeota archaeon]|nr:hypothetical protein [Candidatus Micrarchaeota archaeon]
MAGVLKGVGNEAVKLDLPTIRRLNLEWPKMSHEAKSQTLGALLAFYNTKRT